MNEILMMYRQEARLTGAPMGAAILAVLMTLYYATVVLAGLHFAILQIVALWGIVLMLRPARLTPMRTDEWRLILAVTLIFAVALVSYLYNQTWKEDEANLSRYARFALFVPLYLVIRQHATAHGFWMALLFGTLATGLWGMLEYAGLVRHPQDKYAEVSGAVNSIQFGDISLTLSAMTAAALPVYRRYGRVCMLLAITGIIMGLAACLLSATRGAWIAIPALGLVLLAGSWRAGLMGLRSVLVAGLLALAALGMVTYATGLKHQVRAVAGELDNYAQGEIGESVGIRLEMWRASWALFAANPVLGVGPGLYSRRLHELSEQGFQVDPGVLGYSHPHSEYFFVLATLGASGLFALAFLFGVPLLRFARALWWLQDERRWLGAAGTILVVGYLHFGLTEALLFQHATFLGFYMLSVATLIVLLERQPPAPKRGS